MFGGVVQLAKVHLGVVWLIRTRCQVNFGLRLCLDCYTGIFSMGGNTKRLSEF